MAVNNYIAAAQAAKRSATGIMNSLANTAPDYGAMAERAVAEEARSRANKLENDARVEYDEMGADTDVELNQLTIDTNDYVNNARRQIQMAGKLAGGVNLITASQIYKNRRADDTNPLLDQINTQIDYYKDLNSKMLAEADEAATRLTNLTEKSTENNSTTPQTASQSTAGTETATVPVGDQSPQNGNAPWQKLGNTIAFGEGTTGPKGYTTQFTGTQFSGFADHPRQLRASGGLKSDASGKYQFLSTTWDSARDALGLKDFSPESQEKAGRYLTKKRGVNPDAPITTIDQFREVMDKLSPEWASLPTAATGTSYYGQGGKSLQELWEYYQSQ